MEKCFYIGTEDSKIRLPNVVRGFQDSDCQEKVDFFFAKKHNLASALSLIHKIIHRGGAHGIVSITSLGFSLYFFLCVFIICTRIHHSVDQILQ